MAAGRREMCRIGTWEQYAVPGTAYAFNDDGSPLPLESIQGEEISSEKEFAIATPIFNKEGEELYYYDFVV